MRQNMHPIGYLPDFNHPKECIFLLLEFVKNNSDLDQHKLLEKMTEEKICSSMTTARLILNTLRNYRLIRMSPYNIGTYEVSRDAQNWMKNPNEIDLFKIIDPSVQFLSEMIYELREELKDHMELLSIAQTKYGDRKSVV